MGNRRQKHEQDTAIKLRFYFMSLWLLFVLIFLLTVDIPICFSKDAHFIGFGPLLKRNWLAFISLFLRLLRNKNGQAYPIHRTKSSLSKMRITNI